MVEKQEHWDSDRLKKQAELFRPWNPLTMATANELNLPGADTPARMATLQSRVDQRLEAFNTTIAEDPRAIDRRLEQGLRMIGDRSADRDMHMIRTLQTALKAPYHSRHYSDSKQGQEGVVVFDSRSDIGNNGQIGFPGYAVPIKTLHDALASWVPGQGEQRDAKQVIAETLGAPNWEALRPAAKQQRAYQGVMDHFNKGDSDLQTRVATNLAHETPATTKNVKVYSDMQTLQEQTRGVLHGLQDAGKLSVDTLSHMNGAIWGKAKHLSQGTQDRPLGDWAPLASANVYVTYDTVQELVYAEAAANNGVPSPAVQQAKSQMDVIAKKWEQAKNPGQLIEMPLREGVETVVGRPSVAAQNTYVA